MKQTQRCSINVLITHCVNVCSDEHAPGVNGLHLEKFCFSFESSLATECSTLVSQAASACQEKLLMTHNHGDFGSNLGFSVVQKDQLPLSLE